MIYEIKQFVDDEGRQITEKIPYDKTKKSQFIGLFEVPHPTQGTTTICIEFQEQSNIEECFGKFDEFAKEEYKKYVEYIQQEIMEQQKAQRTTIITPDNIRKRGGFELV